MALMARSYLSHGSERREHPIGLDNRRLHVLTAVIERNCDGTLSRMNDQSASVLQFLKGQEICQIAFGMYDLQINWGNGGLSCTGRVIYTPSAGGEVVWTEGHPFDAVPVLRLLQQTIEAFDGSSEGELRLRFSNGDRLTVAREDGPEGFTIHHLDSRSSSDDLNLSVIGI